VRQAAFELIFLLVILKIPVAYMCFVIWWAVRANPRPFDAASLVREREPKPPLSPIDRRRAPRSDRPHGAPTRTSPRSAPVRVAARR